MAGVDKNFITNSNISSVNLSEYLVEETPATVYYIPNFVSIKEEEQILEMVYRVPKPKWTQLSNRRLQNWGGIPHPNGMLVEIIPEWLSFYLDKVWTLGVFEEMCRPNHVLINEYLPGQGIMPHFDGPLFYPTITTLSLGSHTVLDFYIPRLEDSGEPQDSKMSKLLSLLVEPRSLLILKDDMYSKYLHGIEETDVDMLIPSTITNWKTCEQFKNEYQDKTTDVGVKSSHSSANPNQVLGNKEHSDHFEDQEFNLPQSENYGTEGNSVKKVKIYDSGIMNVKDTLGIKLDDKKAMQTVQRKTRVSLTMRHVPKTSKLKIKLGR
ncbi:alpha-ketoglutarate-dependent dioxygenase alkB homolog 6 [Hetaerina americana]|uniref:alpha-ketoglutarate-dependent dioxygenase alkB homolog 6 n=1 Tax=Hetaerina americana TaxID=62018 RepID=UPI003A7F3D86